MAAMTSLKDVRATEFAKERGDSLGGTAFCFDSIDSFDSSGGILRSTFPPAFAPILSASRADREKSWHVALL